MILNGISIVDIFFEWGRIKLMDFIRELFKKDIVKKVLVLVLLILVFYMLESIMNLILMTFLFTFLIYSLQKSIVRLLRRYVSIHIKEVFVTLILYILIFLMLAFAIYEYIPIIVNQCISIITNISQFNVKSFPVNVIRRYILSSFKNFDIKAYSEKGATYLLQLVRHIGTWSINIFLSLILSLFFMLDKEKIKKFMGKFKTSRISGMCKYVVYFWNNFLNSFGKVIQAQIIIAIINSVLSIIALSIMGFPQLLGLGFMIFILSLIPVAGVIISLVPLCIIAFNIGGIMKVFYVLILIALLHALESYVLNPKLMSAKTQIPVFFTFIILIVSEHFMGVWGLLLGVPLFIFILDLLGVTSGDDKK